MLAYVLSARQCLVNAKKLLNYFFENLSGFISEAKMI